MSKSRNNSTRNKNSVVPLNTRIELASKTIPRWLQVSICFLCIFIYIVTIFFLFMVGTVGYISAEYEREVLTLYQPEITALVYYVFALLYLYGLISTLLTLCKKKKTKRLLNRKSKPSLYRSRFWLLCMDLFGAEGVFGHLGMFNEVFLIIPELFEIPAATFQAWSMSHYLCKPTMTLLFACLIFLNCVLSPMTLSSKSLVVRRYVTPLMDVLFDFTFGVGFSIMITVMKIYSYYISGNPTIANDNMWLTEAFLEGRQVFVTSLPDLITKSVSFIFCFLSLQSLASILRYDNNINIQAPKCRHYEGSSKKLVDFLSKIIDQKKYSSFLKTAAYLWGFVTILIACVGVNRGICPKECNLQVYPWFFTECKCVHYDINCKKVGKSAIEFHRALNTLPNSLIALDISQCDVPTVNVSNIFMQFQNLFVLTIQSTNLKPWEDTNINLPPRISIVDLQNSGVSTLPKFLTTGVPHSLSYLVISGSNLTSLPSDISEKWNTLDRLEISHSLLSEFPYHLMSIRKLKQASFGYNQMRTLPNKLIGDINNELKINLKFDGNPLSFIPFNPSQNATKILASLTFAGSRLCSRLRLKKKGENYLEGKILANMPNHCPESCSSTCIRGTNNFLCNTNCNSKDCNWDFGNCDKLL